MAKFQIIKDFDNLYHFNLKLRSGDIVLRSADRTALKMVCEQQIELIKANSKFAQRFGRQTTDGGSSFVIKDADNQILAKSDNYAYWLDMERSIAAIRSHAGDATVEDLNTLLTKESAFDLVDH